jgi:hypothetical protein
MSSDGHIFRLRQSKDSFLEANQYYWSKTLVRFQLDKYFVCTNDPRQEKEIIRTCRMAIRAVMWELRDQLTNAEEGIIDTAIFFGLYNGLVSSERQVQLLNGAPPTTVIELVAMEEFCEERHSKDITCAEAWQEKFDNEEIAIEGVEAGTAAAVNVGALIVCSINVSGIMGGRSGRPLTEEKLQAFRAETQEKTMKSPLSAVPAYMYPKLGELIRDPHANQIFPEGLESPDGDRKLSVFTLSRLSSDLSERKRRPAFIGLEMLKPYGLPHAGLCDEYFPYAESFDFRPRWAPPRDEKDDPPAIPRIIKDEAALHRMKFRRLVASLNNEKRTELQKLFVYFSRDGTERAESVLKDLQ